MTSECRYCGYQGELATEPPTNGIHGNKLVCSNCGKFLAWEKKEKNAENRPRLKSGTIGEVWEQYENRCAFCGLHKDDLFLLGRTLTVQHVPPYFAANGNSILIPYCSLCQSISTVMINAGRAQESHRGSDGKSY